MALGLETDWGLDHLGTLPVDGARRALEQVTKAPPTLALGFLPLSLGRVHLSIQRIVSRFKTWIVSAEVQDLRFKTYD